MDPVHFVHEDLPQRVRFGPGASQELPAEVARLGLDRPLVLSTPGRAADAARLATLLGPRCAGVFTRARRHTPIEVTEEALAVLRRERADGIVSVGGGTATGLSKAVAVRAGVRQLVVPTTYGGSEATNILGERDGGTKTTRRDPRVLPAVVVYDPDLTRTLPAGASVASGMNAIAHAVEGLYAPHVSPLLGLMAEEGLRAMTRATSAIVQRPDDGVVRSEALYGAWLCGRVLNGTAMALHHKLCHVLGGYFDLPHAETHAILLPHVMAFNLDAARGAMERVACAMGAAGAEQAVHMVVDLARHGGLPAGLRDIGMPQTGLEEAASAATRDPYSNPRMVDQASVRQLLEDAWRGAAPAA